MEYQILLQQKFPEDSLENETKNCNVLLEVKFDIRQQSICIVLLLNVKKLYNYLHIERKPREDGFKALTTMEQIKN